ncbi:MAG TPA: winged helix-turn-helix domain-containing protein [Candidatus Parabacteroides intestinavium]|jgi:streptomycin 6-kinase|nr:winged helix-turn-helix domain-containing protein [Candidatus Parabacteroides intestinavium]
MIELIGTNAGKVWNALNEGGKMSLKALKKATKIKAEKDMYAALGWLAKEGKLAFEEADGETMVSLVG